MNFLSQRNEVLDGPSFHHMFYLYFCIFIMLNYKSSLIYSIHPSFDSLEFLD